MCIAAVFAVGMVLCGLPWLLFLCACFQLRFRSLFETHESEYEVMEQLFQLFLNVTVVRIELRDNTLNEHKLKLLIEKCPTNTLEIVNNCRAVNMYPGQLHAISDFIRASEPLNCISFRWGSLAYSQRLTSDGIGVPL